MGEWINHKVRKGRYTLSEESGVTRGIMDCVFAIQRNKKSGKYRLLTEGFGAEYHSLYYISLSEVDKLNNGGKNQVPIEGMSSERELVNLEISLEVPYQKIKDTFISSDKNLISLTDNYESKIKDHGIEIFNRENNIIVTDDCYFILLYKDNLKIHETSKEDL